MKSKIAVILTILLLFALAGCNNTPQTEKMPESFSFSESNEQISESDTLPAAEETKEVEPTPEPMQSTEPAETESTAESRSTESSKQKEPEQTAIQTSAPQDEPPQKTESETPIVTPETEAPPPAPPVQTETAESVPPQETPPQPKSIYDFEFNIDAIRAELIAVGEGMGLTHSGDLTLDNASWATPVTASADFQGENLKRRLKDYVQSMPELITAYGGNPIQYFTIYAEPLGGGSYRIYFLY
mgnify:FL=1